MTKYLYSLLVKYVTFGTKKNKEYGISFWYIDPPLDHRFYINIIIYFLLNRQIPFSHIYSRHIFIKYFGYVPFSFQILKSLIKQLPLSSSLVNVYQYILTIHYFQYLAVIFPYQCRPFLSLCNFQTTFCLLIQYSIFPLLGSNIDIPF